MLRFIFPLFLLFSATIQAQTTWQITPPAGNRFTQLNPLGETVLPNGRIIKPRGITTRIAPHPYGLTLSPNGQIAVTANSGTKPFSISVLRNLYSARPSVRQIPEGSENKDDLLGAVFMGLAIAPDNRTLYVAGGQQNKIYVFDLQTGAKTAEIPLNVSINGEDFSDGYIGDMVLNKDGSRLFAVDQFNFRMIIVDTKAQKVVENVRTGRYPFGIALSPDEQSAYVANVGMFEYSYFDRIDPKHKLETAAYFPAFAFGSREMREGIRSDTLSVRGLGDPNAPESFSVWKVDLKNRPTVTAKIKTGILVGQSIEGIPAVGGASPNSLVATDRYVFVSNGNNDSISVIDIQTNAVIKNIDLQPDARLGIWKGVIPFGLTLSPDQKRLYVAESGINAVGVIDVPTLSLKGHIPVGWFPSKLKVSLDGRSLIVANAKGYGSGPNGGKNFQVGAEGTYIGGLMKGSVTVMRIPSDAQLALETQKVLDYNFKFTANFSANFSANTPNSAASQTPNVLAPIKYVVFISKENRTYDEVLGQIRKGNGDPSLSRYGRNVSFTNRNKSVTVRNATIMPNHLRLATAFSMADNFYVDADHSADGHRWLVNTYPNEWLETHIAASYGGKRGINENSTAVGRFGATGASGAIYPEDYNQHGSLWDHLHRNKVEFYNFGFGVEFDQGSISDPKFKYGGVRYLVNYPLPGPLYDRTSHYFPTYNMAIPDQFRADMFIQEVKEKWLDAGKDLPPMLTLQLLNDHGAGERPEAGFPFRESYMADNDLALGRVVEFLSHLPQWKNMAIVVTEDDSQDGRDHVDAHRSILMVISPYAKRNTVGHVHYSFGSIFKTFWNIYRIPYLNHYDATAADLSDLFTSTPDFTPYNALPVDIRVFDPKKALTPLNENFDWKALQDSPDLDDEDFIKESHEIEDKKDEEKQDVQANPRIRKKRNG